MYIEPTQRYYRGTEQCIRRARFLILMKPEPVSARLREMNPGFAEQLCPKNAPIRALVRKVAMHQCGHWMMGTARVFGKSITLSGSYGADGLPLNVPKAVYDKGVEVPPELVEAWDKGGGWNSCGSEATLMREWALKTFKE